MAGKREAVVHAFPGSAPPSASGSPMGESEPLADTRDRYAAVVPSLSAALTAVFLWLALFGSPGDRRPVMSAVSPILIGLLVIVTADLLRQPALGEAERRPWRILYWAFLMFLASSTLGLLRLFVSIDHYIGVRQLLIVGGFGTMVLALFRFPSAPQHRLPRARFVLDAATVFAASTIFLWHYLIAPKLQAGGLNASLAVVLVVVVGFMAVFVVVLAMLLLRERTPGTRGALMRLVIAVAMVLGLMLVAVGRSLDGDLPAELWAVALNWSALTLVVSAAVRQRRQVMAPADPRREVEPRSVLVLPYLAVMVAFGFLVFSGVPEAPLRLKGVLIGAAAVGASVLGRQRLLLHENEQLRAALEEQASHDPLTGLRNRRSWEIEAAREIAKARRYGRPVTMLMFDLDGFKAVNDANGHGAGDELLRAVGASLADSLRSMDVSARLGGDEFVVLLPETDLDDARHLAQALCMRLARTRLELGNVVLRVTASIGVAALTPGATVRDLLSAADHAMYEAKRKGRNQVHVAAPRVQLATPYAGG